MSIAALLRKAAEAMDEGRNPFDAVFLRKNEVTLDQCLTLAEQLAIGARIVAAGIEAPHSHAGQAMLAVMVEEL